MDKEAYTPPAKDEFPENNFSRLPYRASVGILLFNDNREVFVAKRIEVKEEAWQMPQGGIDRGEEPGEAVLRELEEETSLTKDSVEIIRETEDWFYYDLPNELASKLWRGRFRGQRQKWFAMRFTGDESAINLETERPEFSEWQWAKPEEVPELIVSFKRRLYEAVIDEFSDILEKS